MRGLVISLHLTSRVRRGSIQSHHPRRCPQCGCRYTPRKPVFCFKFDHTQQHNETRIASRHTQIKIRTLSCALVFSKIPCYVAITPTHAARCGLSTAHTSRVSTHGIYRHAIHYYGIVWDDRDMSSSDTLQTFHRYVCRLLLDDAVHDNRVSCDG